MAEQNGEEGKQQHRNDKHKENYWKELCNRCHNTLPSAYLKPARNTNYPIKHRHSGIDHIFRKLYITHRKIGKLRF